MTIIAFSITDALKNLKGSASPIEIRFGANSQYVLPLGPVPMIGNTPLGTITDDASGGQLPGNAVTFLESARSIFAALVERTAEVNADQTLSTWGKEQALKAQRIAVVAMIGTTASNLDVEGEHWQRQQDTFYGVDQLAPGDFVGAAQDREVRDWIRGLGAQERSEALDVLANGGHERVALALMRSPIPLGIEEQVARAAWQATRDLGDPATIEKIRTAQALVEWARSGLAHLGAFSRQVTEFDAQALALVLHDEAAKRGFDMPAGLWALGLSQMDVNAALISRQFRAARAGQAA